MTDEELQCEKFGDRATFRSTPIPFPLLMLSRHRSGVCSVRRRPVR